MKGFDVDVATYIAKELGYTGDQIEWKETVSANREPFIQQGQVDMVVATYSITDARKEIISFAGPYLVTGQDILTRADDTTITGQDSLQTKKVCGAQGSSSPARLIEKFGEEWKGQFLTEQQGYGACLPLLDQKQVDAISTDATILAGFAAQQPRQVPPRGPALLRGEVRRRPQEGRQGDPRQGERGDREDVRRRLVEEGRGRQLR